MEEAREARIGTYELMVMFPATYADEEVPTLVTKVESALTTLGAKVTKSEDFGKRKLAFPIKHIRQAFYRLIELEADKKLPAKIDQALRLMPEVLRHLLTVREVRTKEQLEAEAALRERIQQKRIAAEERAVADRSVKEIEMSKAAEAAKPSEPTREVSPEELTKKLDELLIDDTLGE
ncbi:MAG: 30S ribosomal protein S6 [Candidatus Kerfeldbacteria bacterium]|nr:30S ribosomal protein S6 [Candidatus Kerfeldbacteria bacterium]